VIQLNAQLQMKRIVFLSAGLSSRNILCGDTDHNGLNELIFHSINPTRWEIWEYRPINHYELVFVDTGVYPYPPGITTGNFETYDIGDIDLDSLTDLLGPNYERAGDTTYYDVTTQESPNYNCYPENLSWHYRLSNRGYGYTYYFTNDLDRDCRNEILTAEDWDSLPYFRIVILENIANNQNIPVWRQPSYGSGFAFGDFDRDSLREFITANPGSSGQVYVFENTDPDQYERVWVDTIHLPNGTDVFSGNDLDSDGKLEFFVCFARIVGGNVWDYFLYMWEATANNIYQRTLIDQIRSGDWSDKKSKCGDVDGDSIDEIVWSIGNKVMIYKATGNNQFQRIWEWNNDHGGNPYPGAVVNICDMNKNGYNEIVVSGRYKTSIFEVEAVRLLRPNGGEVFQDSTQELIRWQKFYPPRCDSLSLFYSTDNGQTYQTIVHSLQSTDTSYLWTVPSVNSDSCKIKIIAYGPGWQYDESDGNFSITSTAINEIASLSLAKTLSVRAFPNPAKALTAIHYSLPAQSKVLLNLYDISGRLVKTLVNETKKPGNYSLTLNSSTHNSLTLSSGVYFLCLDTKEKRIVERVVILR